MSGPIYKFKDGVCDDEKGKYKETMDKLFETMIKKYNKNVLIPCINKKKCPMYQHSNNTYDWDFIRDNNVSFTKDNNLGILLEDLIVIDIDNKETIIYLKELFPDIFDNEDIVQEDTSKGKHYYFKRSELCEKYKMFDKAHYVNKEIDNYKIIIDVKTKCSTGTRGLVVCYPSPNKTNFNIFENDITIIEDKLVDFLYDNRKDKPKEKTLSIKEERDKINNLCKEFSDQRIEEIEELRSDEIEEIEELLNMLSINRSDNYSDWINVMFCLRNVFVNNQFEIGKSLFHIFSKKSKKYNEYDVEKKYDNTEYNTNGIKLGSMHMWAQNDSPEKYIKKYKKDNYIDINLKIEQNITKKLLYNSLSNTEKDLCIYIHHKLKDIFFNILTDRRERHWFVFDKKWKYADKYTLIRYISEKVSKDYLDLSKELKETNEEISKRANEIYILLCNSPKLNQIINYIPDSFLNSNFKGFDLEPNILGFEDGIYDLDQHEFREMKPSDFVLYSTGHSIYTKRNETIQKEILDLIYKTLGNKKGKYFLDMYSKDLHGIKNSETFHIWFGENGRNGKSLLIALIFAGLGRDYCMSLPINNLTGDIKNTGGADAFLSSTVGKRIVITNEPSEKDKIVVAKVKLLTGNDIISARPLFGSPIYFRPQFSITLLTNFLISTDSPDDKAFERRTRVLRFENEYVEKDFVDEPNKKFLINKNLKKILDTPEYGNQFLLLLIDNYKKLITENLEEKVPDFIINETTKYFNMNDRLYQTLFEIFDFNKDKAIIKPESYKEYEKYCNNFNNNNNERIEIIKKKEFFDSLEKNKERYQIKIVRHRNHYMIKGMAIKERVEENADLAINYDTRIRNMIQ